MKYYILVPFLLLFYSPVQSQQSSSLSSAGEKEGIVSSYFQMAGEQSPVYSGKLHVPYPGSIIGHPFLGTTECTTGALDYDGIHYDTISLKLDLYRDQLIACSPIGMSVIIPEDKVGSALVNGYSVIYHQPDGLAGSPSAGYYLQLYQGNYTVLERRTSQLREFIRDVRLDREFLHSIRFYIIKDGRYHPVKSKASVLNLFKDKKRELKQFMKQQRLDFREDAEHAIVASVKYYENLNP